MDCVGGGALVQLDFRRVTAVAVAVGSRAGGLVVVLDFGGAAGVGFGDRRVLAGERPDDATVRDFDTVGLDAQWIVVVQLLGQTVQCRLHDVLG